jgi:hypothetical protein
MQGSDAFPGTVQVRIRLDSNPRYRGSTHDDEVARRMGFKAALVPGAFVYGHVSRVAIEAWGADWARSGSMWLRFRKPVYNGDLITIASSALQGEAGAQRSSVTAENEDGVIVAVGWLGEPNPAASPPALADLPVMPTPEPLIQVAAGLMTVGTRGGSSMAILTPEDFQVSLDAFEERHPIYADPGFVHSGCLMRRSMFDMNGSFRFPSPVVLVGCETQHYGLVFPGQKLTISGIVSAAYERRGRHYFESEEFMIADDAAVVARFVRTSIYASEW